MFNDLTMIIEENLDDPSPKYWVFALIVLGIVLVIVGIVLAIYFTKKYRAVITPSQEIQPIYEEIEMSDLAQYMHRKLDISHLNPKTIFNNTFSNNTKEVKVSEDKIEEELRIMDIAIVQDNLHGDLL